tara:strand:- start:1123 stop:3207 length:2085 start_codon:yes stop_codon:yes gene_type:complete
MIKIKAIIFFIVFSLPLFSFANECSDQKTNFDVCDYAKEYAQKFSRSLPMDISQSMSIESVAAIENSLTMIVQLRHDREFIEKLYDRRGQNLSDYEEVLKNTLDSMCSKENPVGAFIRLGGEVRFIYRFSDGERFLSVEKNNCGISGSNKSNIEYGIYENQRYGFKVSYPENLFIAMGESDNEDGQVFVSRPDNARITAYATQNTSSCNIEKVKDNEIDVNYLRKIENTVIYSGTKKEIVVYKKAIKSSDACLMLDIRYPLSEKELYEDIAHEVAESFRPGRLESQRGIRHAIDFLQAVKDRDFEEVYFMLVADDGRSATIKVGQFSFNTLEEFKSVYDDIFTEPFIELIESGLKPKCCVGGVNYAFENRVYWGNEDLNVVFFFGEEGYTDDESLKVFSLTNKLVPNPSFSCQKAKSLDEKTICNDIELSDLDQKLTAIYEKASRYLNRESYENLVPAQRAFIKNRKNCGSDRQCLAMKMQERVDDLNKLIKNELRDLEEDEVSINAIGASLNGAWEKDKIISTNGMSKLSEEIRNNNAEFRLIIDWPKALFEYQIGQHDATEVTVTQSCGVENVSTETLYKVYEDSYPRWGSAGGSFKPLGMQGYYFVLEFQDDLSNDCGYLVISGRQSSGFKLFLIRQNIENINIVDGSLNETSYRGDVSVSIYGVGSFAKREQSERSLGLPNAAVKMKRVQ